MRAFLHDDKGLGSDHSAVTREYKSFAALYRYAVVPFLRTHGGKCRAEIFYSWDRRYGTPDRVVTWNTNIHKWD